MNKTNRRFTAAALLAALLTAGICQARTFQCKDPSAHKDKTVGDGTCVPFVQECSGAPETKKWKEGKKVRGAEIEKGTAIATFKDGKYPDKATGNHAAIYDGQDKNGIFVWDQWKGQPVHRRHIMFRGGKGSASNDGDAFSVIEAD